MPGIELNLIGRIESFERDFMRVLDQVRANDTLRSDALKPVNASGDVDWRNYYTDELANRVYKAYERDFDQFHYPCELSCDRVPSDHSTLGEHRECPLLAQQATLQA